MREKEHARAVELLQSALQIGIDLDLKDIQFEAHEELSNVLQDIGEFREALEHYRQSQELRHAFSSAESQERLGHLMILYDLDRERQGRKIAEQQSEIHRLESERLSQDVEYRIRELAATAMYLARKNDLLQKLRGELDRFRRELQPPQENLVGELISAIDQEIQTAQILNVEPRSVETYRGRIRSKLHLERGDNLAAFLTRIG